MNLREKIIESLKKAANSVGIDSPEVKLFYPDNTSMGDFSTNMAMVYSKKLKMKPADLAQKLIEEVRKENPGYLKSIEFALPGFVNIYIKDRELISSAIKGISGRVDHEENKKVLIEYTDPNPFKIFHIGHLMTNTIGESLSRIIERSGSKVIRACYQGDVGLHVAKTIWALLKKDNESKWNALKEGGIVERVKFLGDMYVFGSNAFDDPEIKESIKDINKKVFERSDPHINAIYDEGKKVSLEYFEVLYKKLGTKFDQYFFESEVADSGVSLVRKYMNEGVFTKSEGAVVFEGEDHGLHTRVFITSQGLPAYETKELGLNQKKFEMFPDLSESIVVTGNEQSDYFKVILKVFSIIRPEIAAKTKHFSHGMMRFNSGKMSSRKGNIISAEELIEELKGMVFERIKDRDYGDKEKEEISTAVAIGAIKYSVLRQSIGSDIIFDTSASISFEGDSGPYLQYSAVRANSVVEKAKKSGIIVDNREDMSVPEEAGDLEKLMSRYDDVILRARHDYAPQYIVQYLTALASSFNSFYSKQAIIDDKNPLSKYYVILTRSFYEIMERGLWLLGIKIPEKM